MVDTAAGVTLMSKTEDEAYNLVKEMTLNNYQWSHECGQPKRVGGKFDVDTLTLLTAKMDVMTQRLDRLNVNVVNLSAPSSTFDRCDSYDHLTVNCQVRNLFSLSHNEHVAYVNSFQRRPNHDPYANILIILVGSITRTSLLEMSLCLFPRLMLDLHPLNFKDHPSRNKLHHLKKSTLK